MKFPKGKGCVVLVTVKLPSRLSLYLESSRSAVTLCWMNIRYFLVFFHVLLASPVSCSTHCTDQHHSGLWVTPHPHKRHASPALHTSCFLPWGFRLTQRSVFRETHHLCATRQYGGGRSQWIHSSCSSLQWTLWIQNLFGFWRTDLMVP